ncbi:DUF3313 family protein [Bordetella sp. BOR01]|uniref:DUF3313 family protein n=1 Tax=Bordetella sp. BOR01 TaxID=2854779 RepID=UPI001C493597|nr:DUF3313 family protein [Bordetella sp. BOR01]MBV7484299.1 DUF3313 domain-containing protein [Bordetella sp. BOR01]
MRAAAIALSCGLIAGCAAPVSDQAFRVDNAVFFTDAKRLHPVPGTPGLSRYISPQFAKQRERITGIYLAPIEVWLAPDSPYKGLTATDVAALTVSFRQEFLKDPSRRYPVVDKPGPDTMVVRIALIDVMLTEPHTRLLGYLPVGLAVRAIRAAEGISPALVDRLGYQTEATFGVGGPTLFAVQLKSTHPVTQAGDQKQKLDQLPGQIAQQAKRLRATLEAIH